MNNDHIDWTHSNSANMTSSSSPPPSPSSAKPSRASMWSPFRRYFNQNKLNRKSADFFMIYQHLSGLIIVIATMMMMTANIYGESLICHSAPAPSKMFRREWIVGFNWILMMQLGHSGRTSALIPWRLIKNFTLRSCWEEPAADAGGAQQSAALGDYVELCKHFLRSESDSGGRNIQIATALGCIIKAKTIF